MKLIEKSTKETIGEIELKHLPRKEDKIQFEMKKYTVEDIIHSEIGVHILITEDKAGDVFFF